MQDAAGNEATVDRTLRGPMLESRSGRTGEAGTSGPDSSRPVARGHQPQTVAIVNGGRDVLEMLESFLEPGYYNVVFVESGGLAYSQIKRIHPDLLVLCMRIEDLDGFQLLSMLKLDEETAHIPVLTYTTEYEGQACDDGLSGLSDGEGAPLRALLRH